MPKKKSLIKIPDKVKIGPVNYDILFLDEVKETNGSDLMGLHEYSKARISLSKKHLPNNDVAMVVLMHEILHGIFDAWEINIKQEESVVSKLGSGLCTLLKDNPELVDYIRKVCK